MFLHGLCDSAGDDLKRLPSFEFLNRSIAREASAR
jgi:hypothetical protein